MIASIARLITVMYPSQTQDEQIRGLVRLAELIAQVYDGAEEKLERFLGRFHRPAKEWVYAYLEREDKENGTEGLLNFVGNLSRLDQIAKELNIDLDEVGNSQRSREVFKRLKISEHQPPWGLYAGLAKINEIRYEADRTIAYPTLLGQGVAACKEIERLLKLLILFYGGFCFETAFSAYWHWENQKALLKALCNYIGDPKLSVAIYDFLDRDTNIELGPMIWLLKRLDKYTASLPKFKACFGRNSILTEYPSPAPPSPNYISIKPTRTRSTSPSNIRDTLDKIRILRNDLPHDKSGTPEKYELQTAEGLRPHLHKLFYAVEQFETESEKLRLIPSLALLLQKEDRMNRGAQLEWFSEHKIRWSLPCADLNNLDVGTQYFIWQLQERPDYVLVRNYQRKS
ncbi:MAG: hypothetical protein HONDAALG_02305 [Gammaproteobacteria bacterium]|nr:hypothetical protein [Gammaproteobacteria bacterium]